ncbi:MAG: MBL fold metallo-hydrolase, partial [Planctomycetota bacterium]|nr:MBL fold metallo-hydrolase [Planctomycetota bacterium]
MAGKTEPRIAHLEVGKLAACCYIVHAGSGGVSPETNAAPCVVVDPGGDADFIDAAIRRLGLRLDAAFLTHAHADHIGGAEALLALWPGAILACSVETARRAVDPRLNLSVYMGDPVSAPQADRILADGEAFAMAGMPWRAVEVPGHDPGEMMYIL